MNFEIYKKKVRLSIQLNFLKTKNKYNEKAIFRNHEDSIK